MAHVHIIVDHDKHFIIDPITKKIQPENPEKNKLVRYDHNSERYTFEMDRMLEGHDMSLCDIVQIHYINVSSNKQKKNEDIYEVNDLGLLSGNEDRIAFTWLVSRNATMLDGILTFAIRFACSNGDSIDYELHTEIFSSISISNTIINNGQSIVEEYSDILNQWKKELFGIEGTIQTAKRESLAAIDKNRTDSLNAINSDSRKAIDAINFARESSLEAIDRYGLVQVSEEDPTNPNIDVHINPNTTESFTVPEIIDDSIGPEDTWSSEKINTELSKVNTDVTALKEDLGDWSRLNGYEYGNLTPKLNLVKENKYASLNEVGKPPYYGAYDGCNVYSLDIESDVYTFTQVRMILPIDEKGNALAEHINYATSFDNTKLSASKIYLSIADAKESIKSFSISKGTQLRQFDKFPEHTGIPKLENDVKKLENDVIDINMPLNMHSVKKNGIFEKNGDRILLSDARTNLRKGIRLIFEANIVNGADFEIGFSVSEANADTLPHNRFVVNSTTIEYYESVGQTECSNSFTHKLSISKNVQLIFEYLANGTVDICLLSNGEVFKKNIIFTMNSVAVPYVKSNGLVAKDCQFTFICTDIRKKIWCFGDSYFAYSTARWTYYLREHGYDNNVLLDGFPGIGSVNARTSFSKLLKLGKPKIAVWFVGMNDGADTTDSEPNDNWKLDKGRFIALCEENSVEPVFATIPNVPNINHKGKNKWIKESGYRYIDMCHAVGADLDVNWHSGMLSNDKIHPSENGARALFAQVLLDLPEVMIDRL